ncbi:transcriptional regulator YeiL [Lysinibacillus sp. 54212]|uniref:transcriptional regulator YeiL n=1 Tax=Lysinibacillus sp. 54212 TaxID=3119829 RepID=UPI002FC91D90
MYRLQKSEYIQHFPINKYFSYNVESYVEVFEYKVGDWIIEEGMNSNYLFYIHTGKAKVFVTHQNGKMALINIVGAGEFLGDMELLHEQYYSKAVQAISTMIVFAIPFKPCREPLLEDAKFLKQLAIYISEKATDMTAKYSQRLAFPLENRLAEFILQTAVDDIYREKHVLVCDYLGVSYRHLLFTLAQFCEEDILAKDGRNYRIRNKSRLIGLSEILK